MSAFCCSASSASGTGFKPMISASTIAAAPPSMSHFPMRPVRKRTVKTTSQEEIISAITGATDNAVTRRKARSGEAAK